MKQERISYEDIRTKKLVEYGTEFKDWIWILVKQYKDRTHFLFELLQNAEDEKATNVRLFLYKDMFVIEHDGTPFSKADVVSITRVAKSTKNGPDSGTIGKFGIGFKSVYAYTAVPRIFSGEYAFEIRDFIYPYEISNKPVKDNYTRIEIPFDNGEVDSTKAFLEIARALNEQISTSTLLFLSNIDTLQINVENHSSRIVISKEDRELDKSGNFIGTNLLYNKIEKKSNEITDEKSEDYLVITDCEEEAVKLAFRIEGKELVPVRNTNIFTFFPTDKESHQAFYIHAPFDTTPARDNIVEDSERNSKFISNICMMLHGGYCWMRDNGYLSIAGLNATYPIYEYPVNTIFRAIYEEAIRIIDSDEIILPTNKPKVFKKKSEIVMPDNKRLVDIFPDEDIQSLFDNRKIFWIAKDISTDAYQPLRTFLKSNFNFKTYSWPEVIRRLTSRYLELKERSWFVELFSAISGQAISNEVNFLKIPFVRLSNGRNICPYEESTPMVYLNNPDGCENRIDRFFLEDSTIHSFYAHNLRIPNYDIARIVVDEILPKYIDKNSIKFKTDNHIHENIQDLKTIKTAMITEPSIIKKLADSYILTDGKNWYRSTDIHVSNSIGGSKPEYILVQDICNLKFLATEYSEDPKINDVRFFIALGCPNSLAKQVITKQTYLSLVKKFIGSKEVDEINQRILSKEYQQGLEWNVVFEGFPQILEKVDQKKSVLIARFLNKHRANFAITGEIFAANDKSFSGRQADSLSIYTAIGLMISFIPWIYSKDGRKVAVTEVHQHDIDEVYEKEVPLLLKTLPFKAEDEAIEEILSRVDDVQQKEVLKSLLTDPEKLAEYTKAVHKQQIKQLKKEEQQGKSPNEILEEIMGKYGSYNVTGDIPDAEPIGDVEKRTKILEQEFAVSLEHYYTLPLSTLKYTFQDKVTPGEKSFLDAQYNGYCQICNEHIVKYDRTNHYQAINMLKTAGMADEFKEALDLGWNSLCLCPNCAAKYRYGMKDMSKFGQQVNSHEVESGDNEYIYITIGLQDEDVKIRYSPKHFLALQTALRIFKER